MLIDLLDFHSRKYSSKFVLRYFNLEPTKLMMLRFLRSHIFIEFIKIILDLKAKVHVSI